MIRCYCGTICQDYKCPCCSRVVSTFTGLAEGCREVNFSGEPLPKKPPEQTPPTPPSGPDPINDPDVEYDDTDYDDDDFVSDSDTSHFYSRRLTSNDLRAGETYYRCHITLVSDNREVRLPPNSSYYECFFECNGKQLVFERTNEVVRNKAETSGRVDK